MADRIIIDTASLNSLAKSLSRISNELAASASALGRLHPTREAGSDLRVNLSGKLSCTGVGLPDGSIVSILSRMRSVINGTGNYADEIAGQLRHISDLFENGENAICAMDLPVGTSAPFALSNVVSGDLILDAIHHVLGYIQNPALWTEEMIGRVNELISGWSAVQDGDTTIIYGENNILLYIGGRLVSSYQQDTTFSKNKQTIRQYFEDGSFRKIESELGLDFGGKIKLIDLDDDGGGSKSGRFSLVRFGTEVGITESALHFENSIANDMGRVDAEFNIGHFKTEASAHAGLYVEYTDENGNKSYKLSPGAEAKIGASYSLINTSASAEAEIIDNVKLKSKVEVDVGKVGAEGEIKMGFVDGDFSMKAGGKAEAIAAEIRGEVGLDVGGVEAKAGASLNYGVGAHAEVGYDDGKLSFDVGASIGVGGSISFELDVGGLVDNVAEGYENFVDGVEAVGDAFVDGAKKTGAYISGAVEGFIDWLL